MNSILHALVYTTQPPSDTLLGLLQVHEVPRRSRVTALSTRRSSVSTNGTASNIDLETGTTSYDTVLPMPEENGLQNIESAQGDDGGTTARTAWFHPRLTITRHALLVLVPIGLTAGVLNWAPIVTFFLNFFAIIPLAPSINVSTGRLAERTGPCFGGLLNVILGNAVEIIVRSRSVCGSIRSLTP